MHKADVVGLVKLYRDQIFWKLDTFQLIKIFPFTTLVIKMLGLCETLIKTIT